MYSPKVIERNVEKLEAAAPGLELVRYDDGERLDRMASLAKVRKDDGSLARQLKPEEKEYLRNERLLSAIDFRYWGLYCSLINDKGGLTTLSEDNIWESQAIMLRFISKAEEEMYDAFVRGEPVDGILLVIHKARQLGATAFWRALLMHRLTTTKNIRAMTASIDDEKIEALQLRDKRIFDNLPWWLQPSVGYDTKGGHMHFDKLDSTLQYQDFRQMSGLGQGEQFELGHLTEVASAPYPHVIEHDFFPTIPQSLRALHGLESTAQGRGNWWHQFCERVRKGKSRRWRFVFIPWYAEASKYRAKPPVDWKPTEVSLLHAQRVYETSQEFVGHQVMLTREQLYWWESTREEYMSGGKLPLFLTNYCATPEESFQHTTTSAFSPEVLEALRNKTGLGNAYEVRTGQR